MSRTWTFSMEMWDRTKSSLARVSQLADIQDKPKNEDIDFEIGNPKPKPKPKT